MLVHHFLQRPIEPLRGSSEGWLRVASGFRSHSLTTPGVIIIESFQDSLDDA